MRINHRVGLNSKKDTEFFSEVKKMGIEYETIDLPGGMSQIVYFDILESDPNWNTVSNLIKTKGASDRFETYFTDEEILNAEWVRLIPTYEHGYPQPKSTWIKNHETYDDFCSECGTYRQVNSFRIKDEPNLKRNDFMKLIWGSAVLCTPRVFQTYETHEMQGFEKWPIIIHDRDTPSNKVAQLYISEIANPGLVDSAELKPEVCPSCGITKYYSHLQGVMKLQRSAIKPDFDFLQSFEWYGGGSALAYRESLVSNRVARVVLEMGWKGLRFKVVELVE